TGDASAGEVSSWFDSEVIELDVKKIAVVSDMHSNYKALEAVLEDLKHRDFDALICLGDMVGYYTEPNQVVDAIRDAAQVTVMGNHDFAIIEPEKLLYSTLQEGAQAALDHNKDLLTQDNKKWLEKLPMKVVLKTPYGTATLVHGDPITIFGYIYGVTPELFENSIKSALDYVTTDYLMVGHSHLQGEYTDANGKVFVNPGSIGQPRDKDNRAAYAIVDFEQKTHELIRVQYDRTYVKEQIIECCLPEYLATRLDTGE
ncbi:MAG: metallophosphoesterase family protein, partial [Candidatus Heimdallarchaeota archaeon]|nr:metallophosphoesterase family protein [Candidatus Heimdallarchaeota archaeon]